MPTKKAKPEVKAVISFRLRPSMKRALLKHAEIEARTVNSLVEKILLDWLREREPK